MRLTCFLTLALLMVAIATIRSTNAGDVRRTARWLPVFSPVMRFVSGTGAGNMTS